MKKFKRIIVGAGCWSAGCILRGDADTVVIDRHAAVGREFFDSYRECRSDGAPLNTPAARELQQELADRCKSGDISALAPALYSKLYHLTDRFRLWTEITNIRREADCWRLATHDVEGDKMVYGEELIDATPECLTCPAFGRSNIAGMRLNAIVWTPDRGRWENGSSLRPGRKADEFVFSVEIPPETDWATARALLLTAWRKRPENWKSARICTIAGMFEYRIRMNSAKLGENYSYFNSAMFSDPLAALDYAGEATC